MNPQGKHADELAGARVLIAEDEFLLLIELESILRDAGAAEVHACRNVKDALTCAESRKLTVAILDIRLGQEVVTPVARALAKSGTPIMFYTGQAVTEPISAGLGTYRIVAKPVRSAVIVHVLRELIRQGPALA